MNPAEQFCPNVGCVARGKVGEGNVRVHSQREGRYVCRLCGQTFSKSRGTAGYGLKKSVDFEIVVTLLAHGCPVPAVVAAYHLDERTVGAWLEKAGVHCERVHEHLVVGCPMELGQVQADEIKVKVQGGAIWMALALMVGPRLWLAGALSAHRNGTLIEDLLGQVHRMARALGPGTLFAVDGFAAYVGTIRSTFRTPLFTGRAGRPRLIPWLGIAIVQVVKQRSTRPMSVRRQIVQGEPALVQSILQTSQGGGQINTSYIERLNATFRQRLSCLARRTRHLARQSDTLRHGMYLVGCVYNFCSTHDSLRIALCLPDGRRVRRHWVHRTPAMATGLTDKRWSVAQLLGFKVPPPPFVHPKRRGRPPKLRIGPATS